MRQVVKVLFCSPYLSSKDIVKGGINTWGRYVMEYATEDGMSDVEILPISFDRNMSPSEEKSILSRFVNGIKAYRTPVKDAVSLMKSADPDVLHICTSAGYGLLRDIVLLKKAKIMGIKSVVHFHFGRIPDLQLQNNWEWKLISKVIKLCDTAVVMNRPSEKSLLAAGFTNVKYLPNPLAMNVLKRIEGMKDSYKRSPRRLLYAGHVIKTKGVYELVEACTQIQNIELRIVGKCMPDVESDLKAIASEHNQGKWLNIVGEVDHDGVLAELLQADMLVFPSYTEGFPNVILEAMACGCPIVSSDVGAIPEILDMNGTPCGVCFKPKSVDEIRTSVMSICDNDQLKKQVADNAARRLRENYIMTIVWRNLINIWKFN